MLLTRLLHDRLADDVDLAALLSEYDEEPAVFTDTQVPEDAERPYIWIMQSERDAPDDTKTATGRRVARSIWCVAPNTGSWSEVETIALKVRDLLHRRPLSGQESGEQVAGWLCAVQGPVSIESEDKSVVCLALTLDIRYLN